MTKIRALATIHGGTPQEPVITPAGEIVDLDKAEADRLIASGHAEPAPRTAPEPPPGKQASPGSQGGGDGKGGAQSGGSVQGSGTGVKPEGGPVKP